MLIGRVIGRVVATVKAEGLEGVRLLIVQPLDDSGAARGAAVVAADATLTAGPGDLVHYEGGREAAMALDPAFVPVDHTIMGLIDNLSIRGEARGNGAMSPLQAPGPDASPPQGIASRELPPPPPPPKAKARRRNPPGSQGRSS